MKPGLPTMFANYKDSLFFGLSGNPVSCVVGYYMFAKSCIDYLIQGEYPKEYINKVKAKALHSFTVGSDRPELVRGKVYLHNNTLICESTINNQLSSTLKSLKDFNCLIHIPSTTDYVKTNNSNVILEGTEMDVFMLERLVFLDNDRFYEIQKSILRHKSKNSEFKGCCHHNAKNISDESQINRNVKLNSSDHHQVKIKVALLVISDKLLRNEYTENLAMTYLKKHISQDVEYKEKYQLIDTLFSQDLEKQEKKKKDILSPIGNNKEFIQKAVLEIVSSKSVDVLITSGGTGVSPKDCTSEAIKEVIHKRCSGIESMIMQESLKINKYSCLSSPVCGIINNTLVITAPGNPKAVKEIFDIVEPVLLHVTNQISLKKDFH